MTERMRIEAWEAFDAAAIAMEADYENGRADWEEIQDRADAACLALEDAIRVAVMQELVSELPGD